MAMSCNESCELQELLEPSSTFLGPSYGMLRHATKKAF
jgi:hypothetical protein